MIAGKRVAGDIILAENVDFETYLREFMGQHTEWIAGTVVKMAPTSGLHDEMSSFLTVLLGLYLQRTGEGKMRHERFSMR